MIREKRLLRNGEYENPQWAMAIEEAILRKVADGTVPDTLRFWKNRKAIIIGRFQCPKNEINIEYCSKFKMSVIRRFSGGGTVYQDSGNLNFSFYIHTDSGINQFSKVLDDFGNTLVTFLKNFGLSAKSSDRGIYVKGKKICGFAGTILKGAILVHGCILVASDIETLYASLNLGQKGINDKFTLSRPSEVTTIAKELGEEVTTSNVEETLTHFFEKTFKCTFILGEITSSEFELAEELYDKNYSKLEWHLTSCRNCPDREKDTPILKELVLPSKTEI